MTNDYYKVFQERCKNHGKSFKSLVQSQAALDFQRFLVSSPNAIDVTVNDEEEKIRVATILNKEKNDTDVRRFFLANKEDGLKIGDFIYWDDTVWILLKKEKNTIDAYDKFEGLECRHNIKWIDKFGVLQSTPCYLVAQTDEKVKANFRTWNNMITPQPNKYLEIITSRKNIELSQRFLIDETAWLVVETDYISVKGIIYLSLTEDKKDLYEDDINNDIADIVDLNKFQLKLEETEITLGIDETYQLSGKTYLNGNLYSSDIIVEILEGEENISIDENLKITGVKEGNTKLRISMEENNEISQELNITIQESAPANVVYDLKGDASIKWGRTKVYQFVRVVNGIFEPVKAEFSIEDKDKLIKNYEINETSITITANEDNRVGEFYINCTFGEETVRKEIKVTSLWM